MDEARIDVMVAYALPERQFLIPLRVAPGTSLLEAVMQSGILDQAPEHKPDLKPDLARVGVFGKLKTLDTLVREGDRIEIYRPLIADPKDARRKRAADKRA